jgi:hypothetical protein
MCPKLAHIYTILAVVNILSTTNIIKLNNLKPPNCNKWIKGVINDSKHAS